MFQVNQVEIGVKKRLSLPFGRPVVGIANSVRSTLTFVKPAITYATHSFH